MIETDPNTEPTRESEQTKLRLQTALQGKYEIDQELGMGVTSYVYKATQILPNDIRRVVAIKILKPSTMGTVAERNILAEMKVVAKLVHPRILPVYDVGIVDNLPYYSMLCANGGSLEDLLTRDRSLSEGKALEITKAVAEALQSAHKNGQVHRDVKPANILFHDGECFLSDFGLTRKVGIPSQDSTDPNGRTGTPLYMSPEQWAGSQVLPTSDLYNLGCVLFEMLTGRTPFTATDTLVLMKSHVVDAAPALAAAGRTVSPDVEQLVRILLEKEPERRFPSTKELIERIDTVSHLLWQNEMRDNGPSLQPDAKTNKRRRGKNRSSVKLSASGAAAPAAQSLTGHQVESEAAINADASSIKSGRIWHFSDLHLEHARPSKGKRAEESEFSRSAFEALFAYIATEKEHVQSTAMTSSSVSSRLADVVVITGDIEDDGEKQGRSTIIEFLEKLASALSIPKHHIVLVPGAADLEAAVSTKSASADALKRLRASQFILPTGGAQLQRFDELGLGLILVDTSTIRIPIKESKTILDSLQGVVDGSSKTINDWVTGALSDRVGPIDIADLTRVLRTADRRRDQRMDENVARIPPSMLGIVLSNYPLVSVGARTGDASDHQRSPVGASKAIVMLQQAGIHLSLHGQSNTHSIHRERLRRFEQESDFISVGAPSLSSLSPGFNSLRYALCTRSGEARLVAQSMTISGGAVSAGSKRRLSIAARRGKAVRMIRIMEKITLQGDARTDTWFSDISTLDWTRSGDQEGYLSHELRVNSRVSVGTLSIPAISVLAPRQVIQAEFVDNDGRERSVDDSDLSNHLRGFVKIRVPSDLETFSLVHRTYSNVSYAVSLLAKIRCRTSKNTLPDLAYDANAVVYFLFEPSEILEIFVRFPAGGPRGENVELRTYLSGPNDDRLEPAPQLREMSECLVDTWHKAGHVRATVKRPLRGVAYGLAWRLPDSDPGMRQDRGRGEIEDAIAETEFLRTWLWNTKDDPSSWARLIRERFFPFWTNIVNLLTATSPALDLDDLEIALTLPAFPHLKIQEYRKDYDKGADLGRQHLRVLAGHKFKDADARYQFNLPVPESVVGRAYAANQAAEYLAPDLIRAEARLRIGIEHYWTPSPANPKARRHSVLYAVPIRHWTVETVVIGSLSIGSFRRESSLDLWRQHPTQPGTAAEVATFHALTLAENLWNDSRNDQ